MSIFKTLLLREWMQHRTGWLVLVTLPAAIALLLALFGHLQVGREATEKAAPLVLMAMAGVVMLGATLAWVSVAAQAPGLARRDQQDRSIEFWRSLPAGDATSIAATLCAHLLLAPLAVMAAAVVAGAAVALIVSLRVYGWGGLALTDWAGASAAVPRLLLGSVLASVWAASLLLPVMAASAWLKRWGVAALAAVVGVGGLILDKAYNQPWLLDTVASLFQNFNRALLPSASQANPIADLSTVPAWLWQDAQAQLQALASPVFGLALGLIALSFWLLVQRRRRA